MKTKIVLSLALSFFTAVSAGRAEEKAVGPNLLTSLSSTTISGYIDSSHVVPPLVVSNIVELEVNQAQLTPRDLTMLSWMVRTKRYNLVALFCSLKEAHLNLPPRTFDALYQRWFLIYLQMPSRATSELSFSVK